MTSLGEVWYLHGIEIIRNRAARQVVFSQAQYVRELLQRFHMAAYIGVRTLEPYGALH
ncbi:hypothetical protein F444_22952, partial [Phytophthora nicotianae P1976]